MLLKGDAGVDGALNVPDVRGSFTHGNSGRLWDKFLDAAHRTGNDIHQTAHYKNRGGGAPTDATSQPNADSQFSPKFDPMSLNLTPNPGHPCPEQTHEAVKAAETPAGDPEIPPLQLSRVLGFCLPALGAVLADPLMSLVDTACVGQVSSIGLAALGPNTSVFGFASMVFQFFTVATTAIVSRAHDRGDNTKKSQCVSDALSLAVVCGMAASAMLIAFGDPVLRLLYTPPELMAPALQYLQIRALALPAALVTLVGTAASLGQRDSKTPLRVALATGTFNFVVDLFLVLGPPKLGIFGAAIATCGSQYIGAIYFLHHLSRGKLQLSPKLPSWNCAKPFISAGGALNPKP